MRAPLMITAGPSMPNINGGAVPPNMVGGGVYGYASAQQQQPGAGGIFTGTSGGFY